MKKETLGSTTVGAVNGRMTRARVAALHASEEIIASESSGQSKQHGQDRASQEKPKRAISDGNGSAAKTAFAKRYKKTALQDVTNVCCSSLHKDCFNVTKILVSMLYSFCQCNACLSQYTLLVETRTYLDGKKLCTVEHMFRE